MFSFLKGPETHPEAKTFAEYYQDIHHAAEQIRQENNDADADTGFARAAEVFADLVVVCNQIEIVSAIEAGEINDKRHHLQMTVGSDGMIDVTGEASKALALKFIELTTDLLNKKYWPAENCPTFMGQSFLSVYGKGFEHRKPGIQKAINDVAQRIADYDHSLQPKIAV